MFSDKFINLEIITPDKMVYKGQVNFILMRTLDGNLGIYPNHEPLIGAMDTSPIKVEIGDEEHLIAVFDGFVEVTPDKVTILSSHVELPEEIDVDRAEKAKARAEERLSHPNQDIDVERAELALRRALTRLKATNRLPFE